jgi:hypothetical protein
MKFNYYILCIKKQQPVTHNSHTKNSKPRVGQKPILIVQVLLSRENLLYAQWLKECN